MDGIERLSELERLMEKGTYKIAILTGNLPVYRNAARVLGKAGYPVVERQGPSFAHLCPSPDDTKGKTPAEILDAGGKPLQDLVDDSQQLVEDILQDAAINLLMINYADVGEAAMLLSAASMVMVDHALEHRRALKLVHPRQSDYGKLHQAINLGRATRLWHHELDAFQADFRKRGLGDATVNAYCIAIHHLLTDHVAQGDDGYRLRLQQALRGGYDDIQRMRRDTNPATQCVLAELAYRMDHVHLLVFDEPIQPDMISRRTTGNQFS